MESGVKAITEMVRRESAFVDDVLHEVDKVIVGQRTMVERILIGLLTGGHILLEGVPGLAKTLTVNTVAHTLRAKFRRIQFTPDLLPADLVGTMIYNQHDGTFSTRKGPVFANLVLADEVNRAPAKVQSALLEAMQEKQVTIGDTTHVLDEPFLVMATQNPIEQEGTYPLPEAQVDRFMLKVKVGYPTKDEELEIMDRVVEASPSNKVSQVLEPRQLVAARDALGHIIIDRKIKRYIVDIVFATRQPADYGLGRLTELIAWGASPRASIYLNLAARAHAFLRHHGYVDPEDIKSVAMDVLRHRVIPTYEAEAEELSSEDLIQQILEQVEVP